MEVVVSVAVFGVFLGIGWLFFGYLNVSFTAATVPMESQKININKTISPDVFNSQTLANSYF